MQHSKSKSDTYLMQNGVKALATNLFSSSLPDYKVKDRQSTRVLLKLRE